MHSSFKKDFMKHLFVFICLISSNLIFAQGRFDDVTITTTQIKENLYMLEGAGGNIAVLTGDEGVIMIDAQFADLGEKIKAAIDKLSDKPLKYLVNTHWHGDHTGGNEVLTSDGGTIVAHDNVKVNLSQDRNIQAFNRQIKAKPETYWPDITYNDQLHLSLNGQDVFIQHVHNAHTDGDSFVFFTDLNVLHMGDVFFNKRFPFIDLSTSGSIDGYIRAVETAMMMVDEDTVIIPGHGELANQDDLEAFLETIKTMRERVANFVDTGKSIEEIKTQGLEEGFESWGTGFISAEKFIDTIWTDLNR